MTDDREARVTQVVEGMAAWTVLVVRYNGMVAERMGVTASELQCLYALAHHGPATPGTLARWVNLTSGSASRMVDRLDAAGHIRRVPDPADRRRVLVEPLPRSLELVAEHYAPLTDRLRRDLDPFDDEGLARLDALFRAAETSTDAAIRQA